MLITSPIKVNDFVNPVILDGAEGASWELVTGVSHSLGTAGEDVVQITTANRVVSVKGASLVVSEQHNASMASQNGVAYWEICQKIN